MIAFPAKRQSILSAPSATLDLSQSGLVRNAACPGMKDDQTMKSSTAIYLRKRSDTSNGNPGSEQHPVSSPRRRPRRSSLPYDKLLETLDEDEREFLDICVSSKVHPSTPNIHII